MNNFLPVCHSELVPRMDNTIRTVWVVRVHGRGHECVWKSWTGSRTGVHRLVPTDQRPGRVRSFVIRLFPQK